MNERFEAFRNGFTDLPSPLIEVLLAGVVIGRWSLRSAFEFALSLRGKLRGDR